MFYVQTPRATTVDISMTENVKYFKAESVEIQLCHGYGSHQWNLNEILKATIWQDLS